MGKSLSQVIAEAREGDRVAVSLTTNEDDGIASYAEGELTFHPASTTITNGGVGSGFRRTRLATSEGQQLKMYFSDRRVPKVTGQPFRADATEGLGASLSVGFGDPLLTINLFGNTARFAMAPSGNLLVGTGPQFGTSPAAIWVLAFIGIIRPPA